jgi:hypothetical protein
MSITLSACVAPTSLLPNDVAPADANNTSTAQTGAAALLFSVPSARSREMVCGGGSAGRYFEFTESTNPAAVASDLAAAAKTQRGSASEFSVYAVRDDRIGQPVDGAFINGARVSGYGMKGGASLPIAKLVATVMASGALQRGGTLVLGNIGQSTLTPGLLSGLAQKHGITIAIESRGDGIDLHQPNGTVTSDPSRVIGELHLRGGCGPGLQKPRS